MADVGDIAQQSKNLYINYNMIQQLSISNHRSMNDTLLVDNLADAMRLLMADASKGNNNRKDVDDVEENNIQTQSISNALSTMKTTPSIKSLRSKKVLIILDLNGILFERVLPGRDKVHQNDFKGFNAKLGKHLAWKRPGVDSFTDFVLSRFYVGVWSSARLENVNYMVDFAFPKKEQRRKIRFIFSQEDCTANGYCKDRPDKPMFMKELKKVWDSFPGEFDQTNTLLIDDSIEKVALNPPFTAIHPPEWTRHMQDDKELMPGGNIYEYLLLVSQQAEKSHGAFNIQEFVRNHPFDAFGDD